MFIKSKYCSSIITNLIHKVSVPNRKITQRRKSTHEIREKIQKMRVENTILDFTLYKNYKKWNDKNEALEIFLSYVDTKSKLLKINHFRSEKIFEDLKILLNNLSELTKKHYEINDDSHLRFLKILSIIYIENFTYNDREYLSNINYGLRCFAFIKNILEHEFLVRDDIFLEEFLRLLSATSEKFSEQILKQNFQFDSNNFIYNYEELYNKLLSILETKYIVAYNPKFYYNRLPAIFIELFKHFENYFLNLCFFQKNTIKHNFFKFTHLLGISSKYKIGNNLILDYIQTVISQNKENLDLYQIIDVVLLLSSQKLKINFDLLNFLYVKTDLKITQDSLLHFPFSYLSNLILIFSQTQVQGNFILIEKLIKIILKQRRDDLSLVEDRIILNLINACFKSKFNSRSIIDQLCQILIKNKNLENIDSVKILYIRNLMDRLVGESYENLELIKYIYINICKKIEDLEALKTDPYDNDVFINYIKDEIIISKENILPSTYTEDDLKKYYNMCLTVKLHCLFKLNKNFQYLTFDSVRFTNEKGEENVFRLSLI
jgi:hypothetical protein